MLNINYDKIFYECLSFIKKNKLDDAKNHALKYFYKTELDKMGILNSNSSLELIKFLAGYDMMSDNIKIYYVDPTLAI